MAGAFVVSAELRLVGVALGLASPGGSVGGHLDVGLRLGDGLVGRCRLGRLGFARLGGLDRRGVIRGVGTGLGDDLLVVLGDRSLLGRGLDGWRRSSLGLGRRDVGAGGRLLRAGRLLVTGSRTSSITAIGALSPLR